MRQIIEFLLVFNVFEIPPLGYMFYDRGLFWAILAPSWPLLKPSWGILGLPGGSLGAIGALLGHLGVALALQGGT